MGLFQAIFWITLTVWAVLASLFVLAMIWLVVEMVRGGAAPFQRSRKDKIQIMLNIAELKPTDAIADLGSGDGEVVLRAAERGVKKAVGYEIDPLLLAIAEKRRSHSPHASQIEFRNKSLWDVDLNEFDVIFIFQSGFVMKRLEERIDELKPGTRIVSNKFKFPGWNAIRSEKGVYLYAPKNH